MSDRYPQPYDDFLREVHQIRELLGRQVELLEAILHMQGRIEAEIIRGLQ